MTSHNQPTDISNKSSHSLSWRLPVLSWLRPGSCRLPRGQAPELQGAPILAPAVVDYRLTVRTQTTLAAVRGRPGLNNIELSEIIGLSDQGQMSRIVKRLETQGLLENTQAHANRHAKAWRLTMDGKAVLDAHRGGRAFIRAQRKAARSRKLATTRSAARRGNTQPTTTVATASTGFRMTALTHEILTAIANLSQGEASPSNREIALAAARDEGHISKLLRGLQDYGLLQNTGPVTAGAPKAWRLTPHGEELLSVTKKFSP